MAPASGDERSSTPQSIRKQQKQRPQLPISASSRPLKSRKKKAPNTNNQDEPEYKLKRLLEKKVEKGRTLYLVDWEDADDGTSYQPTWEPKQNINAIALAEWEEQHPKSTESRASTPAQSRKRKRKSRQSSAISEEDLTSKRVRREEAAGATPARAPEVPDSYEEQQPSSNKILRPQVEIPTPSPNFDRSAYVKVNNSSQPSGYSISQESTESVRPFRKGLSISDLIIQDSQDIHGSSSYRPSDTATSKELSGSIQQAILTSNEDTQSTQNYNQQLESSESFQGPIQDFSSQAVSLQEPALGYHSSYASQLGTYSNLTPEVAEAHPSSTNRSDRQPIPSPARSVDLGVFITPSPRGTTPSNPRVGSYSDDVKQETPKSESTSVKEFGDFQQHAEPTPPADTRSSPAASCREQILVPASSTAVANKPASVERGVSPLRESSLPESELFLTQVPLSIESPSQELVGSHVSQSSVLQRNERHLSAPISSPLPDFLSSHDRSQSQPAVSCSHETTWQGAQITSPPAPISTQYSSQGLDNLHLGNTDLIDHPPVRLGISEEESREYQRQITIEANVSDYVLPSVEPAAEAITAPSQPRQQSFDSYTEGLTSRPPSVPADAMDSQAGYPAAQPKLSMREQLAEARHESSLSIPAPLAQTNFSLQTQGITMAALMTEPESPGSNDMSESDPQEIKKNQIIPLAEKEYLVPLPMVSWVRNMYRESVDDYDAIIQAFINHGQADEGLVQKISVMATTLNSICSHPDLIDPNPSVGSLDDKDQAGYAEDCSTKCMFLRELLSHIQESSLHVAVLAESTKMLNIIETLFKSYKFEYTRPDQESSAGNDVVGNLRITLLPTKTFSNFGPVKKLNAVIVFDGYFGRDQLPILQGPGALEDLIREQILLVSLRVVNSVEHFELCIPRDLDLPVKNIRLANCIEHARNMQDVGEIELDITSAAHAAGSFIASKGRGSWDVQEMPYIYGIEDFLGLSQPHDTSAQAHNPLPKRPLTAEDFSAVESSKRPRLTPQPEPSASTMVNSESGNPATQVQQDDKSKGEIEGHRAKCNAPISDQETQVNALLQKISDLELQHADLRGQLDSTSTAKDQLERQVKDLEKSVRVIQPKYQEALNERGQSEHDKEKLLRQNEVLSQRLEARNKEITKLKEDNEVMEKEVSKARMALTTSGDPVIAELGRANEEAYNANLLAEKANKKLNSVQMEADYLRENYQQASNKASEAAREIKVLKAELEKSQQMASSNLVHIHQMQHASESRQLVARITELETMLNERNRDLDRKAEELRARMNGRRETRGVSAPRSPRMGNGTMSPRTVERIVGTSRSRGSSPAASGMGLPPTNESAFRGDVPYPPGTLPRWNHLQ